ncbi:hypothetical protein WN944_004984 [Citrus x changshan-huyou]|uniref:Uncharacterized protein n=1 Tax=Citrus x changshan-huyou TaxID=2935761 RepID=A0AAP0QIC8_9ROSI
MTNFFADKAGLKPSDTVRCSILLLASWDKRIYPRWSVLQVLMSKDLLDKDVDVIWALNLEEIRLREKESCLSYG